MYLDIENRARLVSMRNKRGETPLHVLAGASMRNSADSAGLGRPSSRVVGLATLSGRSSVVSMQVNYSGRTVVDRRTVRVCL